MSKRFQKRCSIVMTSAEARVNACSEDLVPALELCKPTAISRQLNPTCMGRDFYSGPRWLQFFFSIRVLHCHVLLWGTVRGKGSSGVKYYTWGVVS